MDHAQLQYDNLQQHKEPNGIVRASLDIATTCVIRVDHVRLTTQYPSSCTF
jgi:hypothetical protein